MGETSGDHVPAWLVRKREYNRRYNATHREQARLYSRRFAAAHRAQINADGRAYYAANRATIKAKNKERSRSYYVENREKVVTRTLAWARAHPEVRQVKDQRRRAHKCQAARNDFTTPNG